MNWCRLVAIFVFILSFVCAENRLELLFEKANEKYLNGDYRGAIELYKKILKEGYESDRVYYNLGNAYYRVGELGRAILFYEKALKLNPGDENVRFNLRLANLRIKDRVSVPPPFFLVRFYRVVKNLLSSRGWALVFASTVLFISVIMAIIILSPGKAGLKRVIKIVLVVLIVLGMFELVFLIDKYRDEEVKNYGIVVVPSLKCLSAPQEGSTVLFIMHEGIKVRILDKELDWFKIELPDGKQGWVKNESIGVI